ncbi:asparaginase [Pseudomonas nicosulfuronedens]|uniref:asparaginase n=1 Tax=Pseudomonas nicosulfuronedens TaxID=2571105 RepID=A0A5R9R086_9PSED|nr:asparaginase [Pseudomonas nicosulfuronedens]MDH1011735.1 asparaginase [Pseudomonas nicosulfuronedens]MDH1980772.1 asparaginase [Pseudomonas nicosulfuronedens]MDH2027889.1 asparaginase [Pseudomonas nicosulfuronedens]TLX75950.1 asparaginase [Pseudomonas nicosulfuronedens]
MRRVKNLFVLYTGGTIGMLQTAEGLAPAGGFEARMREQLQGQGETRLNWTFAELQPLLDSANMTQANWLAMRDAIVHAVELGGHDGVLVLHGTDTLAYSAAALSFLLLGLKVPVLLTGSMQPMGAPGSDAPSNLLGSLTALERGVEPGVWLFFNGELMHGARVTKLRSDAFDAFAVLPRERQGERAESLPAELSYRQPRQPVNLVVLPLFPGLRAEHLRALLGTGVQALLLECFGSGTGPSDNEDLLAALREAHARGVVLAAISQCPQGHVAFDVYAAGSRLRDAGLVSGGGMTREAALGKLFSLIGSGLPPSEVERLFALDLCGERVDAR